MSELLCTDCGKKLTPSNSLRARRLKLKRKQAILLGGLAAVVLQDADGPGHTAWVFSYVAPGIPVHRSTETVVDRFVKEDGPSWAFSVCRLCRQQLEQGGWEETELEISPSEDIAVHGLGWLSVRKSTAMFRVVIPAGVHISRRPHLVTGG